MSSAGQKTRLINVVLMLAGAFVALGALYYNGGEPGTSKGSEKLFEKRVNQKMRLNLEVIDFQYLTAIKTIYESDHDIEQEVDGMERWSTKSL